MNTEFILDENGKIADNDKIFDKLYAWHDNSEYDNILEAVYDIPRTQWSNKLWFRLISALNNKKMCEESRKELDLIKKYCVTPNDKSHYHYMLGFSYYMEDAEITALKYFLKALEEDKDYADEVNLQEEIERCRDYIDKSFENLAHVSKSIAGYITTKIKHTPEKYKKEPDYEEFVYMLAFLPCIRKVPVLDKPPVGFDELFFKYDDEEKEAVLKWLKDQFDVYDKESLKEIFANDYDNNRYFLDVRDYLNGTPSFDINELNEHGRFAFESSVSYIKQMIEYIPDGGLAAWDLSERIGMARHLYACGKLTNSEYTSCIIAMTDEAQRLFSSWEEYLTSLILGSGYFLYSVNDFNVTDSIDFMMNMISLIFNSPILDMQWLSGDEEESD